MFPTRAIIRAIFFSLTIVTFQSAQAGLVNGGFELPAFGGTGFQQINQSIVPGWKTTAGDSLIELWYGGFGGFASYQGTQHAEINATQPATLFQDVPVIPVGNVVGFQFAHRGRYAAPDVMRFTLTDLGSDNLPGGVGIAADTVLFTQTYSDANNAWGFYTGTGIVTLGNVVRFSFVSVSSGGNVPAGGNFLDAADFGIGVGVPVLPTVTVTKVSNGGVGTFGFSGSNGFANQSITTLTSGTGVAGAAQTLTAAGVSTAITEAVPPAGYTLSSIACTGLGAGGTQTSVIGTRTVTLDAAATAAGAAIACTFTNNFVAPVPPTVTVTKVSNGGVGTFGFSGSNGFANQSITTLTSGTGVAGAAQTLTAAGVSTAITEAVPPAGYTLSSIACTGLGTGGTQTPDIGTRTVTLNPAATAAGAAIACTFTNTFAAVPVPPTMTVTKVSNGGVGPFSFTGNNGFTNQTVTTVTTGVGVAGAAQTLTAAGVSTAITEAAPPAGYTLSSIACTGLGAGGTQTSVIGTRTVTLNPAATAAGAAIACTFTNTFNPPLPPGTSIPTLSEWTMILLAALMAITGFIAMRRKGR